MAVNDSFPLFSTLPIELRIQIWSIAFSDHVVVGFLSHTNNMGLCHASGRPIISPDHSSVARSCKEAWQLMSKACHRVKFTTLLDPSSFFTTWVVDFSKTIFYLGHGHFSHICIAALNLTSAHVQHVVIVWSTYWELITTCKRLTVFPALRRVIILFSETQDPADCRCFLDSGIDLNSSNLRVQSLTAKFLSSRVDEFLRSQVQESGQQAPIVEAIDLPVICKRQYFSWDDNIYL